MTSAFTAFVIEQKDKETRKVEWLISIMEDVADGLTRDVDSPCYPMGAVAAGRLRAAVRRVQGHE